MERKALLVSHFASSVLARCSTSSGGTGAVDDCIAAMALGFCEGNIDSMNCSICPTMRSAYLH